MYLRNVFSYFNSYSDSEQFKDLCVDIDLTPENLDNLSSIESPKRQTEFSAGYDLSLPYSVTFKPKEKKQLFFGFKAFLPDADGDSSRTIRGILSPRSSLAKKKGLVLVDNYKLIEDGDFIFATFENFTSEEVSILKGERIAQICFVDNPFYKRNRSFSCMEVVSTSPFINNLFEVFGSSFYFQAVEDVILEANSVSMIKTAIKCKLLPTEVLFLSSCLDSSLISLANGIGVVDSDYYNNEQNEGEIAFLFLNRGYVPFTVRKGSIIGKGWIGSYLTLSGDIANGKRKGGIGSTDQK